MGRWVGEHGQNRIGNSHLDSHGVNPLQSGLMSRESMNSRVSCVSKPLSCPHHRSSFPLGPQPSHPSLLRGKLI